MKYLKSYIFVFCLITLTLFPLLTFAQTNNSVQNYQPLAPLPGNQANQSVDIVSYVKSMYMFIIGFSVVLAIIMIVVGGITMMSSDSVFKHEQGKKIIQNAIIGLILAVGSWLILYTINPNFVDLSKVIKPSSSQTP